MIPSLGSYPISLIGKPRASGDDPTINNKKMFYMT